LIVHHGKVIKGSIKEGEVVNAQVDEARRLAIARNHSTTHLLHKALKEVLGDHVNQGGSLVEPEKMRFDFTHFSAVSKEQLKKVEQLVNRQVFANLPVESFESDLDKAKEMGAAALFGEKYGDKVRVVKIGDFSLELCGGTHVLSSGQTGFCKIISEGGVGAGLRRLEVVTGQAALTYLENKEEQLKTIGSLVKANNQDVVTRVNSLVKQLKEKEKEISALQGKMAKQESEDILDQVAEINGVKTLTVQVAVSDMEALRAMGDMLRDKLGSGVIVLGAEIEGKVNFVSIVTKDLVSNGLHAGNIIREVAKATGGGGGGRPDMAQAGGKDPAKIKDALDLVKDLVNKK